MASQKQPGFGALSLVVLLLPAVLGAQEPAAEAAPETSTPPFEERVRDEVEGLHHFFQEWFNGTVENTDAAYSRLTGTIADGFVIVTPTGALQGRDSLIDGLRGFYAPENTEPVRVWVERLQIRRRFPTPDGEVVMVTYEEWEQRGTQRRGRLNSALLRERAGTPNGFEWLHVHATWLPPDLQVN